MLVSTRLFGAGTDGSAKPYAVPRDLDKPYTHRRRPAWTQATADWCRANSRAVGISTPGCTHLNRECPDPLSTPKAPDHAGLLLSVIEETDREPKRKARAQTNRVDRRQPRSFTRRTPRGLFGSIGLMAVHL